MAPPRIAQQLRQPLIGRITERQAAIQLQHERPGVEGGQRLVGELLQVGVDFAAQRVSRHVVIVGATPQNIRLGLHLVGIAVVQHRAHRHAGEKGAVVFRQPLEGTGAEQQAALDAAPVGHAVAAEVAEIDAAVERRERRMKQDLGGHKRPRCFCYDNARRPSAQR